MITRAQKIRLGIFIMVGMFIITVAIAVLSYDQVFARKDTYYIAYTDQSLSGIEVGSRVKYLGVPVGSVRDLQINPDDPNQIIVTVAIKPDTPIREDAAANLQMVGITGMMEIELTAGSREADRIEPESFIQPGISITDEFVKQAETIARKIDLVLENMLELTEDESRERLFTFIDEAHGAIVRVNRLIDANQERMERTVTNVDTLITQLNRTVASANAVLIQTEGLVVNNRGKIDRTVDELNLAMRYLNETARMINNDPSVLIRGRRHGDIPDDRLGE